MKRRSTITVCTFLILLHVSVNVYAIFTALWEAPVTVRIGPLTPRSSDLSVFCSPSAIKTGDTTTVSGKLVNATSREGISGQEIRLYYKPSGNTYWTYITWVTTIFDGTYVYLWTDASALPSGFYVVNATFSGSADYDPWMSLTDFQVVGEQIHDVSTINVTPSKTIVGQSYFMSINATVENQGDFIENFNLTVHANTTAIETLNVTDLPPGNTTTLTFTWNTTNVPYGNYTIRANATIVSGETDTADNTLTDGWVFVTVPGDINGDRIVDIYDAILLALRFGVAIVDPKWNPNADINGDNIVDIYDAIILAGHFGEQCES